MHTLISTASHNLMSQITALWKGNGHIPGLLSMLVCWRQQHAMSPGFEESYEDNAVRELEEEMGIMGACLETLFDFWYSDDTCRLWGRLFRYSFIPDAPASVFCLVCFLQARIYIVDINEMSSDRAMK